MSIASVRSRSRKEESKGERPQSLLDPLRALGRVSNGLHIGSLPVAEVYILEKAGYV